MSLDTLADRLGLLDMSHAQHEKPHRPAQHVRPGSSGRPSASAGGHDGPVMATRPRPKQELSFFCCFTIPIEEVSPPPRPQPRPLRPTALPSTPMASRRKSSGQHLIPTPSRPRPGLPSETPLGRGSRQSSAQSTTSQTAQYLSLLPPSASPQTASQLMAQLAKPVSQ
ncbi:MAG: hypothetical protein OK454_11925, partial [Thaumarchaeota archaeon]|nr:hypothetical protein [Nitrososphaerota archaeon]